ncbi:MAG: hypothetical protein IJG62_00145 [Synergistaceae bacterium]|nr:hypothetical protein [Synergistaceae bacterium]MBQ3626459.1 hypothetical protein [Synergistaceae bacterium]MBQ6740141.1 hypothetical protein [Synergistaceae bacterium]MBQ7570025.1 hypothetical protein [Synergistaceae bacterium]MBQ9582570.1 hypothetical protein [Synergistaceae bacterium]
MKAARTVLSAEKAGYNFKGLLTHGDNGDIMPYDKEADFLIVMSKSHNIYIFCVYFIDY